MKGLTKKSNDDLLDSTENDRRKVSSRNKRDENTIKLLDSKQRTREQNKAFHEKLGTNATISKYLMAYEESDGEREHYPDALDMKKHIDTIKREALDSVNTFFKYGFSLDGKFYFVNSQGLIKVNGLVVRASGIDYKAAIERALAIPQIYLAVGNLMAEVNAAYELVKTEFEEWIGKQWKKSDDPGSGMYNHVIKRVEAYIRRQPEYIEYRAALIELKAVATKLKTIGNSLFFQQNTLNGIIYSYKTRQNNEGVIDSKSSMMNSLFSSDVPDQIDFGDDAEEAIQSFDLEDSSSSDDNEDREVSRIGSTPKKNINKKKKDRR